MTISGYLSVTGWLPDAESTPNRNSHISFGAKLSGKPGAGKRHAGFDVAGTGNVNNGSRIEDQRESSGVTTEPYSQRACSRPYLRGAGGEIPPVYSPDLYYSYRLLVINIYWNFSARLINEFKKLFQCYIFDFYTINTYYNYNFYIYNK